LRTDIKKVAVLGAGTMGAQVAAQVAGQGLEVVLLDLPSPAPDRSAIARKGLETLRKLKPSPLHLPEHLAAIRAGNFEDDQGLLADADWVFEAVVEDLEVKRQLFGQISPALKKTAIVTSNTSGLGIAAMTSYLPVERRRRWSGPRRHCAPGRARARPARGRAPRSWRACPPSPGCAGGRKA